MITQKQKVLEHVWGILACARLICESPTFQSVRNNLKDQMEYENTVHCIVSKLNKSKFLRNVYFKLNYRYILQ